MESHQRKIKIAVSEALSRAGLKDASEVDGVAVTQGPGLEICLRVGIEEAKVTFLFIHSSFIDFSILLGPTTSLLSQFIIMKHIASLLDDSPKY